MNKTFLSKWCWKLTFDHKYPDVAIFAYANTEPGLYVEREGEECFQLIRVLERSLPS